MNGLVNYKVNVYCCLSVGCGEYHNMTHSKVTYSLFNKYSCIMYQTILLICTI